jgi:hypothetical protein
MNSDIIPKRDDLTKKQKRNLRQLRRIDRIRNELKIRDDAISAAKNEIAKVSTLKSSFCCYIILI